jgi:hypothetical protein
MLVPTPAAAKCPHQAFALTPPAVEEARRLARKVVDDGALAATPAIGAWLGSAAPARHDRRTALDPRVAAAMARVASMTLPEGDAGTLREAALAAWSPTPRDVWREAERSVVYCVLRLERLVALDAPSIIVESELAALQRAVPRLDGEARVLGAAPEDDPGGLVELRYAIVHHARFDLSLGTHTETLRAVRGNERSAEGPALSAGEPLVPSAALEARHDGADEHERRLLDNLRFWKIGSAMDLAEVASELADGLAEIPARARAKAARALDKDEARSLRGGDYVAAAEARLREIADDARAAARDGLVVLSETLDQR